MLILLMKALLWCIGLLFGLVVSVFILFAVPECVKLPNGIIVSRDSYFNFTEMYWRSNVVVKGPDGTILSRGNDDTFYFSETTAWWIDSHPGETPDDYRDNPHERLAYRLDVGLVSAWENPELYEQLQREAGPLLEEGKSLRNTNVLGVLTFLKEDPEYYSRDCKVPLFTFEKAHP